MKRTAKKYGSMSIKLSFEKTINSKMLKLSVADVHSSFAVILICQLCAHGFGRCHGDLQISCSFGQKS